MAPRGTAWAPSPAAQLPQPAPRSARPSPAILHRNFRHGEGLAGEHACGFRPGTTFGSTSALSPRPLVRLAQTWSVVVPALWYSEDPSHWAAVLAGREYVLRVRARAQERLEAPDRWYREELPAAIKSRKDKHVTREDLKRLLVEAGEGPFQPRLQQLVASNPPELVVQCSAAAFRILPDVRAAITELYTLRGVGPATASAVLAAGGPEVAAFMSDGAVAEVPGLPALHYTPKDYFLSLGQVRESSAALNQGSQLMGAGWEGTQDAIKVQVASAREPQSPVVLPSECLRAVDPSPCGDSAVDLGCGTEAMPRHAT